MARSVPEARIEGPGVSLRKLTIDEYHRLGEAGIFHPEDRVELIDGLLVQMAPIGPEHQFLLEKLSDLFSEQKKGRYKVGPGRPIPIPDFTEPQPDMVLFNPNAGSRKRHVSAGDILLVIEISDTTLRYDLGRKRLAYERAGIPEYWVIDIAAKTIRVFRLDQRRKYQETRHTGGLVAVQALPGVSIDLGELF
jgi:Uma2 family endonuclease